MTPEQYEAACVAAMTEDERLDYKDYLRNIQKAEHQLYWNRKYARELRAKVRRRMKNNNKKKVDGSALI